VAAHYHLRCTRDIILSGFQLELYSPSERACAYWAAARVLKTHVQTLDVLLQATTAAPVVGVNMGTGPLKEELVIEREAGEALGAMCLACFAVRCFLSQSPTLI
jgi:N-alpha-acetyltransferase 35, NatC auxiliary subunit